MSIKRGIVVSRTSSAARNISISSTLPIGLVVTSNITAGLYGFDSAKDALENDVIKGSNAGNLLKYLKLGVDQFPAIVPIVISVANIGADDAETKTNVINATNALKSAAGSVNLASAQNSAIGFKPDIVAVADWARDDADINNAMVTVCESIKARCFLSLDADSNGDAITKRDAEGSERLTVAKCDLGMWNTELSATDTYDSGVVLAFLRAYVDSQNKIGYSYSISNRELPFSSVKSPSEFYAGALDETDPLTEKQIMSFISYKGLRTWEYSTCSADPIWQDARRVRIFDLAAEAVIDGIFYAVDKDIGALTSAKKTLRAFMSSLVGDEVMVGFDVKLDLERTTPERVDAGEFYFTIEAQEMPSPKLIHVTFDKVNKYSDRVYKIIGDA